MQSVGLVTVLPLKKGVELAKMEIIEQDCVSTVSAAEKGKSRGYLPLIRKPMGADIKRGKAPQCAGERAVIIVVT